MNPADEIYNYEYSLKNAYKLLEESSISKYDKELIRSFINHLSMLGVSKGRLAKYAFTLKNLAEQAISRNIRPRLRP